MDADGHIYYTEGEVTDEDAERLFKAFKENSEAISARMIELGRSCQDVADRVDEMMALLDGEEPI